MQLRTTNMTALGYWSNNYSGFYEKLCEFEVTHNSYIKNILNSVDDRANKIESIFMNEFENVKAIRRNRVIDLLLIQIGREMLKQKEHNKST